MARPMTVLRLLLYAMPFGIGLVPTPAAGAATTKAAATTATTTGHDATTAERRRAAVKRAFVHAYRGYSKHAFGHDEIRPVTNRTNDSWGGLGATLAMGDSDTPREILCIARDCL